MKFPTFEIENNYKLTNEASRCAKVHKKINTSKGYIFLDDYRLGDAWKKIVKKRTGLKLIYLSDKIKKEKIADFVINYKINANEIKKNIRYNDKTKYLWEQNMPN